MERYVQNQRVGVVWFLKKIVDFDQTTVSFMILDPCQSSPCGPRGKCIPTNQAQIPYYCRCPDGQNTMFKCADPSMFIFFV